MTLLKVVFDTNCYYAAAAQPTGYMRQWLEKMLLPTPPFLLFSSRDIIYELQNKLENKLSYSAQQSAEFCLFVEQIAAIVYPTRRLKIIKDADDNKILECAVEARAHLIVSFDKDLIKLKQFEGIKIAHPSMLKYWFRRQDT